MPPLDLPNPAAAQPLQHNQENDRGLTLHDAVGHSTSPASDHQHGNVLLTDAFGLHVLHSAHVLFARPRVVLARRATPTILHARKANATAYQPQRGPVMFGLAHSATRALS